MADDAVLSELVWASPQWICNAYLADQLADFGRHGRTTRPTSRLPVPVRSEACAVPAQYRDGQLIASVIRGGKNPRFKTVGLTTAYCEGESDRLGKLRARVREMRIELTEAFNEFEKSWQMRQREKADR